MHRCLFIFLLENKLFCSFIDFKRAFDTVWRIGLWQKMQKSNVQGKFCKVIFLKSACAFVINSNSSENFVNLLFKTAENILLIHEPLTK
jgi:hypothetical protein